MSELEFALKLAELGGRLAAKRFAAHAFTVQRKGDGSPVTEADREAELAMRDAITEQRPGCTIVGEEFGGAADGEWCWYLDPVDGTARFIVGDPQWMTLVALARGDEVMIGVVEFPVLGTRWWAQRGQGAFHDGVRVHVSQRSRLAQAIVNDDWRGTLAKGRNDRPIARLAARAAEVVPHHGHNFLSVAAGEADAAVNIGGYPWDYAPLQVIVAEAGGCFTDLDGGRGFRARSALASNGLIHAEALTAVADGSRP